MTNEEKITAIWQRMNHVMDSLDALGAELEPFNCTEEIRNYAFLFVAQFPVHEENKVRTITKAMAGPGDMLKFAKMIKDHVEARLMSGLKEDSDNG